MGPAWPGQLCAGRNSQARARRPEAWQISIRTEAHRAYGHAPPTAAAGTCHVVHLLPRVVSSLHQLRRGGADDKEGMEEQRIRRIGGPFVAGLACMLETGRAEPTHALTKLGVLATSTPLPSPHSHSHSLFLPPLSTIEEIPRFSIEGTKSSPELRRSSTPTSCSSTLPSSPSSSSFSIAPLLKLKIRVYAGRSDLNSQYATGKIETPGQGELEYGSDPVPIFGYFLSADEGAGRGSASTILASICPCSSSRVVCGCAMASSGVSFELLLSSAAYQLSKATSEAKNKAQAQYIYYYPARPTKQLPKEDIYIYLYIHGELAREGADEQGAQQPPAGRYRDAARDPMTDLMSTRRALVVVEAMLGISNFQ
nr:unnamed protein product [Digitaria exilis]